MYFRLLAILDPLKECYILIVVHQPGVCILHVIIKIPEIRFIKSSALVRVLSSIAHLPCESQIDILRYPLLSFGPRGGCPDGKVSSDTRIVVGKLPIRNVKNTK